MARVVKCDICRAEIDVMDKKGDWSYVAITSDDLGLKGYDLCPICSQWLMRTIEANIKAMGYTGGKG